MILSERRCFSTALKDASASRSFLMTSSFSIHHCLKGGGRTRYNGRSGANAYKATHAAKSWGALEGPPEHERDLAHGLSMGSSASAIRFTVGAVPGGGFEPLFSFMVLRWTRSLDRAQTLQRTVVREATS